MQITICGGGNAAHVLAGSLASRGDMRVQLYLAFEEEAARWQAHLSEGGRVRVSTAGTVLDGAPARVSSDPAEVIPGSQLILLALPAFAHESTLRQIGPHLDDDARVGSLPARGGFDLCAQAALGDKLDSLVLFGLQTLPWACRITTYAREVHVLGTKARVDLACRPDGAAASLSSLLTGLLGLAVQPVSGFLNLTIANTGQLIHPGIMYGLFHAWDGQPLAAAPLFYQGVTAAAADTLEQMSAEVQALAAALRERFPALGPVPSLAEWLHSSYEADIAEPATLQSSFTSNRSYAGLKAPVREIPGGFEPDFKSRYLTEDVPYGLLVTRGIAALAGVHTPVTDRVIAWAQERMGKHYLRDGALTGRDLPASRVPQRFGIDTLEDLLKLESSLRHA